MNLKQQREAALKAAREIAERVKGENRGFTDEEQSEVEQLMKQVDDLKAQIEKAEQGDALMAKIAEMPSGERRDGDEKPEAKSLGEAFVRGLKDGDLSNLKARTGFSVSSPDFKAATDAQTKPSALDPATTQVDTNIVRAFRRPTVSDLFGQGTLSGSAITYFVESATVEGGYTSVAEGGQKPQLHIADPTAVTETLKKIAAWWDVSDEMVEDLDFWVSEINNRALYLLALEEESQLLNGSGSGSDLNGLLKRTGVQTEALTSADDTVADALFRAMTKIQTVTGLSADALVINPSDYQGLRLAKDGNSQYYGGGYFSGEYGNGGVAIQPPVWGLRTVVSAAVDQGTAVVGSFKAGATVYRKGGIRVESTNSDLGKFTKNVITNRIEERLALAVRIPSAFVNVDLSAYVAG